MEIHINTDGNVVPASAEAFVAKAFGPEALDDSSSRTVVALGFDCPDCPEKAAVEIGTSYDHKC